jgi:hypothetical protein
MNITYTDKDKNASGVEDMWRDVDANEVKAAVNSKQDGSVNLAALSAIVGSSGFFKKTGPGTWVLTYPEALKLQVLRPSHGLIVSNILTVNPLGALEKVTNPSTQKFAAIVSQIIDVDNIIITLPGGYITGLSGLTLGAVHYGQADGTLSIVVTDMPVLVADGLTSGFLTSSGSSSPGGISAVIAQNYTDIADMLADQANQESGKWYRVLDASDDPAVDAGWCIYEYNGTIAGDLTDYFFILDQESLNIVIQDASPTLKGILKLYTSLGTNTDGTVDQATIKANLDLKANDSGVVHNTGDETVAGIKTFSSFTLTPSSPPTTDYQTANKKYVDDSVSSTIDYAFAVSCLTQLNS